VRCVFGLRTATTTATTASTEPTDAVADHRRVRRALNEEWKGTRGPAAATYARNRFSVTGQVSHLLAEVDRLT
jgi:hypothetical protein